MNTAAPGWRLTTAILLFASAAPAAGQRKINERFDAAPNAHIRILNIAGSVKITGWDRDSIAVTGTVHDTPAERFTSQRSDSGITIGIWDETVERAQPSVLEVRVPTRSVIQVRTGSASIFMGGISGDVTATSVGGDIEIRGSPRAVAVESMTGAVVVDVRSGSVRVKTVTSAIRIHGVLADLTATSVSGNILLEDADVTRGSFESVGGELRFVGAIRPAAALDFVTHAGAVEFLLPATAAAEFRIGTYEGGFHSEFDVPVRTTASKIKGSERRLTLGRGGAQVNVRTFRGRVVLRSR